MINSAGIQYPDYFERIPFDVFDQTVRTNLYGIWNVLAALVPAMKGSGGHIVNVSSIAGFMGVFGYTAYSATKFGVIGFSEALRSEMRPHGIRVSVLCPPDTDTPGLAQENRPSRPRQGPRERGAHEPHGRCQAMLRGMEKDGSSSCRA